MTRPLVFVSYARPDADEMKHLCSHLGGCPEFELWADTRLEGGEDWDSKIREVIGGTDLAILLVTAHFLNSKFIREVEVPLILERHQREGTVVFPVIGKDCVWDRLEWLRRFNVRPVSGVPVWGEGGRHADGHLARIAREVAGLLSGGEKKRPGEARAEPAVSAAQPAPIAAPLRTFEARLPGLGLFATDARGRLWVCDGEQVKVFGIGQSQVQERWLLPERRWKCFLPEVWGDRVVFADWDGSLYAFSRDGGDRPLYQAHDDDLPIHRLGLGPRGRLAAASWDGRVRSWDASGKPGGEGFRVAYLPTQVLPIADDLLAVADQADYLRLFNLAGRELWSWRAPGRLHTFWAWQERGEQAFLAQIGRARLIKVLTGTTRPEVLEFGEPIISIGRQAGGPGGEWAVIAREGGKLDWVCASPFLRVVRENHVEAPFAVRDVVAVRDPRRPADLLALGLSAEGQLFGLEEREARLRPTPGTVRRLALGPTGGFVFLLAEERVCVIRNPVIAPLLPSVEVEEVRGVLSVQAFNRVTVRLRNTGVPAIHEMKVELCAEGLIDPARLTRAPALPLPPGEKVEVEFAVRARVAGSHVPLTLKLELADEGGPPLAACDLSLDVESRAES